ncbi:MAG: hypothetical protein WCF90_06420 [Methanomicrobiales archaeon]
MLGLLSLGTILLSLILGILGYMFLENQDMIDAFPNAAMLLGGTGPVSVLNTAGEMIFWGSV